MSRRHGEVMNTPSAPTGDHGGLRGAVERLAAEWEREAAVAPKRGWGLAHAMLAEDLRATLAAHPEPEPAQDGEVGAVLAGHRIECTGVGEVSCRGCRDKGWMTWHAYEAHLAAALVAALVAAGVRA